MKSGDLCHIPQGVTLREGVKYPSLILTTEKPEIGIFLKEDDRWAEVVVRGQRWSTLKNKIYPMEDANANQTN